MRKFLSKIRKNQGKDTFQDITVKYLDKLTINQNT